MLRSRRIGDERGVAAVEFAIVSLVLFLVLFGIIQFGIAFNRSQGMQAAAREGGRLGALPETTLGDILTRVRNSVSIVDDTAINLGCPADLDSLSMDSGCVKVSRRSSTGTVTVLSGTGTQPCFKQPGATVLVTAAYRTKLEIPMWGSKDMTITGDGEFACEA